MNHDEQNNGWLTEQFEDKRGHLRAVAYRMLGSASEADDAVQEAWLRLSRSDASDIENLGGWLTTVVARVCLDMLRSRKARREESLDAPDAPAPSTSIASHAPGDDPEHEALVADAVGVGMLLVLDTLDPPERVAFVLHDMFGVSFDQIAPIVNRNAAATRQLASRARRRVQGKPVAPEADLARQRAVVDAFLAAARGGDFSALLTLLDPDVVFRSDATAVQGGASPEVRGADAVASFFAGKAQAARPALVDGVIGVAVMRAGRAFVVLDLTISGGRIAGISAIADPAALDRLDLAVLED